MWMMEVVAVAGLVLSVEETSYVTTIAQGQR